MAEVADTPGVGHATSDGVTVYSNQQTSDEIRAGFEQAEKAEQAEAAAPEAPEKRPNPRKDLAARVQQQSGELANKDQALATLNERLAEIDTLKKELAELKAPKPPVPIAKPVTPQTAFTDAEPTLEQFASSEDPYRDYMRALAAYDRKKDAFEQRQVSEKERTTQDQQAREAQHETFLQTKLADHDARLGKLIEANPDALKILEAAGNLPLTPLMRAAIEFSDHGEQLMLELAQNPKVVRELVFKTSGQLVFDNQRNMNPLVQVLQDHLGDLVSTRTGAAVVGSAPVRPTTQAHPPINPVVGSHAKPSGGPPGDDATYEEHEAYWNRQEREASGRR